MTMEESTTQGLIEFLCDFNRSLLMKPTDDELDKRISQFLKTKDSSKGRKPGLHVSMFSDPCLRRLVLHVMNPDLKDTAPPNKLQRIFDCGTSTHHWFQEDYLGPMGILEGTWQCSGCGKKMDGAMPDKPCDTELEPPPWDAKIASCADLHSHWRFLEPRVQLEHAGLTVVGSCDGILNLSGKRSVLEMKTKDSKLFAELLKPEIGHVVQGSLYAIKLVLDTVTIVYIEKNEWKLKVYQVPVEPWVLEWFTGMMEQVSSLVKTGDYRIAPLKCANKDSSRAMRCGARQLCFPKKK